MVYEIAVRETASYLGQWRLQHYESEGDAGVVVLNHGKGKYIFSTIPTQKMDLSNKLYGAIMTSLNVPALKTQPFLTFTGITTKVSTERATENSWKGFAKVDLVPYANKLFIDKEPDDKIGGWDDTGSNNDMRNLPTGDYVMAKVPFHIIDTTNDDINGDIRMRIGHSIQSCLVLKGKDRNYFPEKIEGIKVGNKANKIHFLHTATWCNSEDGKRSARYVVNYKDGTNLEIPIHNGIEIADWWDVGKLVPKRAKIAWRGSCLEHSPVGLYMFTFKNPNADKEISTIDFVSDNEAVPILIAITLERQ
jgi:hypothetical protein